MKNDFTAYLAAGALLGVAAISTSCNTTPPPQGPDPYTQAQIYNAQTQAEQAKRDAAQARAEAARANAAAARAQRDAQKPQIFEPVRETPSTIVDPSYGKGF